jgi:hypothetical protein
MRVDEAIVKGLESVGIDGAFGGPGELALEHSTDRGNATFVRHVYLLVNILAMFFACGVSHA